MLSPSQRIDFNYLSVEWFDSNLFLSLQDFWISLPVYTILCIQHLVCIDSLLSNVPSRLDFNGFDSFHRKKIDLNPLFLVVCSRMPALGSVFVILDPWLIMRTLLILTGKRDRIA